MSEIRKRAGGQLANSVAVKVTKKSTVVDPRSSEIPMDAKTQLVSKNSSQLHNDFKKKTIQNVSPCETPKMFAPKVMPLEETPKKPTTPTHPLDQPKRKIKKFPNNPEKLWKDVQKLSPGTGRLLDDFMKQHNNSLSDLKRKDLILSKKMQTITMESLQKNTENINLKEKLSNMERELTLLKKDILEQQEKNAESIKKYMEISKKYTHCEKNYDNELEIIKVCAEKKNTELKAAQSRIAQLDRELKNMEETNRELSSALGKCNTELEQSLVTNSQILEHCTGITGSYESLRLQFEDVTAQKELCEANFLQLSTELNAKVLTCAELQDRVKQLPIEANKVLSEVQNKLESKELLYQEQQRLTDQATKDLELARNEINTYKTHIDQMEVTNASLKDELTKMTAKLNELVDINESYYKELAEAKFAHSQEMNKQAVSHENALRDLKGLLNKASLDYKKLKNSNDALRKENLQQVTQLQGQLKELELQCNNQKEIIKTKADELQKKTELFEEELKGQKEQLYHQIQDKTTEFESEAQRSAVEIQTLKAALGQKDEMLTAQQEKFQVLMNDHDNLQHIIVDLQADKEEIDNEYSTSKLRFTQELESQKDNLMKKISELELEVNVKATKLIELEREKNNEMAVLQFKMNRINSLIDQPVSTISKIQDSHGPSNTQGSINKVQPKMSEGVAGPSKKRTVRRHQISSIHGSDFETEDEMPIVNQNVSSKRAKMSAVVKPQNGDVFDMLKKTT
ncbi:COP1-interactive protein 1 [Drosophila eugracilis]|uniref:COP1-interactive protein 1 n=1 Tax=Drosophila eugracilis TaxID=29029 RepID=UPI001BD9A515|nr:COP1-interactive protein 1 [Drosophila eugracilis]XP_017083722.2 COP1-interactive protein 1 [Drosophila eugracilis]